MKFRSVGLFLTIALVLLVASEAKAIPIADLTTADPTTFTGTLDGVAFTGTYVRFVDPSETNITGTSTLYSNSHNAGDAGTYTPPLPMSDSLGLFSEAGFTITFAKPIQDPIFDFFSLANTLDFGTHVTLVSAGTNHEFGGAGGGPISASGNTVIGVPVGNGDDSNGTIQLLGTFTTISATAVGNVRSDGIGMIFGGAQATPEPSSLVLMGGLGLGMLGYGWYRRKRVA